MKKAIHTIDMALQELYNLEGQYQAKDFLLSPKPGSHAQPSGALYLQHDGDEGFNVGIYLNQVTQQALDEYSKWQEGAWTHTQLSAFSVAAEEVSHFRYWLFHGGGGRGLSELEMELQGEIDKFFVTLFAQAEFDTSVVEALFQQIFEDFRLIETATDEQKERYREASHFAKNFIQACRPLLESEEHEKILQLLRKFYRLNMAEKVSWIQSNR